MNWAGIRFKELRYTSYIFTVHLVLPYIIPYILENLERLIKKKFTNNHRTSTAPRLLHKFCDWYSHVHSMFLYKTSIMNGLSVCISCVLFIFCHITLTVVSQWRNTIQYLKEWFTNINVYFFHTVVTERRPFTSWLAWWGGGGGGGLAGTGIGCAPYTPSSTSLFLPMEDFLWAESRVAGVFLLLEWSRHSDWWTPFSSVQVLSAGGGSSVGWWGCCWVCCSCWRLNCSWRLRRSRSFSRWRFLSSRLQYRPSCRVRNMSVHVPLLLYISMPLPSLIQHLTLRNK